MRSMYRDVPSICRSESGQKSRAWFGALLALMFFFGAIPTTQAASLFKGNMDLFKGNMDLFKGNMNLFENRSLGIWGDQMDSVDEVNIGPLAFEAGEDESPLKSEILERFRSRMTGFPFEKSEDGITEGFEWRSGRIPGQRVRERLGDLHEQLQERFRHRWGEGSGPPAAVPLPPAVLLFGSALGFLVGVGRRRFKAAVG